jgi:F0F1-type ATP synthase delta subunit
VVLEQKKAANVTTDKPGLVLPVQILSSGDISRLSREIEDLSNFFEESALKSTNTKAIPQSSHQLTVLVNENHLNILHKEDRERLGHFLNAVREKAPLIHVSFATDPKPDFLMKLIVWFRSNAHPYVLIQVGLQPNIAAGCVLRTTNKYFDFSFKQHFEESKSKLGMVLRSGL